MDLGEDSHAYDRGGVGHERQPDYHPPARQRRTKAPRHSTKVIARAKICSIGTVVQCGPLIEIGKRGPKGPRILQKLMTPKLGFKPDALSDIDGGFDAGFAFIRGVARFGR